MTNPDFRPYVNLTLFNQTASDVYDASVAYAKTAFPEFNPRVGTVENALLESMAFNTASLILTINRLPNSLLEGLLNLMGFARIEATPAKGTVEFTLSINTGSTIVAGTLLSYDVFDSEGVLTQYLFETDEDLEVASGFTTGQVAVSAIGGGEYPDIPIPQTLTLVSTTPFISAVSLTALSTTGTDDETDAQYFDRGAQYLRSLSSCIVTNTQLSNYLAVQYPSVGRFKVYDLTESSDMDIAAADVPGSVTIALCDSNGDAIGGTVKTTIETDIESKVVAGLAVDLYDMETFNVNVDVDVVVETAYSTAAVSLAVSDAVEQYLSIVGWDFADSVTSKYITAIASKITGVKYVDSVTLALGWAHANCRAATTANINLSTDLENGDLLDGVTLATNDRVLVKNQSTGSQNGIYVVQASGAAVRATDADASSEFANGMFAFVTNGTANGGKGWLLTNTGTITLGTTALTFSQFEQATYNSPDIDLDKKGAIPIGTCTTTAV